MFLAKYAAETCASNLAGHGNTGKQATKATTYPPLEE